MNLKSLLILIKIRSAGMHKCGARSLDASLGTRFSALQGDADSDPATHCIYSAHLLLVIALCHEFWTGT